VLGVRLDLRAWLDLVALGTVADVAPLDGDNRRLVRAGLRQLAGASARPGVAALREAARVRPGAAVSAVDIAFRLAPRLNAAGRLGDPSLALPLLRARTVTEARMLAARLEQLNDRRKDVERRITAEACAQVETVYGPRPEQGVVVASDTWNRGVVGITAARLADRYGVPAVVIAVEDGVGHGSGRAPERFPLYDAVRRCGELLIRHGGHQAAAGLSVPAARVEALRAAFSDATAVDGGLFDGPAPLVVDVAVGGRDYAVPTVSDLAQLEPVGEANREPVFALPTAEVLDRQVVGGEHLSLSLRVGDLRLRAFGRQMAASIDRLPNTPVGHLRADTWHGGDAVELHLVAAPAR